MSLNLLRAITFCIYLACWALFVLGAVWGALPRGAPAQRRVSLAVIIGALLQALSPLPITLSLQQAPLRPGLAALVCVLILAPSGAGMFLWAMRSRPKAAGTLATAGAYAFVRHPVYSAFFAMLVATGLLASSGVALLAAAVFFITGSELRIAVEERELPGQFGDAWHSYRRRTRWRYLPGVR
jgi:protein-S-isoprenylcysteine O-methyltransferase Ste14